MYTIIQNVDTRFLQKNSISNVDTKNRTATTMNIKLHLIRFYFCSTFIEN